MDQYGFLDPLLGRFKRGIPNPDDLIHLGPSGLKRFVRYFKDSILHKKSSSVKVRGGGGGGKSRFSSFYIFDQSCWRRTRRKKLGPKSDLAFLRYRAPNIEVYM